MCGYSHWAERGRADSAAKEPRMVETAPFPRNRCRTDSHRCGPETTDHCQYDGDIETWIQAIQNSRRDLTISFTIPGPRSSTVSYSLRAKIYGFYYKMAIVNFHLGTCKARCNLRHVHREIDWMVFKERNTERLVNTVQGGLCPPRENIYTSASVFLRQVSARPRRKEKSHRSRRVRSFKLFSMLLHAAPGLFS